jgi:hypothetical protein
MSTGTPNTHALQTFIVRIYRTRGAVSAASLSGTLETIPGGSMHAFDSMRQLCALLTDAGTGAKKSAPRRSTLPKQPTGVGQ